MQILPSTARTMGYTYEEMFDPVKNVQAGTEFLIKLKNEKCNGDLSCATRSFFCGYKNRNSNMCHSYERKVLKRIHDMAKENSI